MHRAVLFVIAAAALAAGWTEPVSSQQRDGQASSTNAEFESLRSDVWNLYQSLLNKNGVTPEAKPLIEQFRSRAVELRKQMPNDTRPLAIELQLSTWLKDTARADDLYQQILRLDPRNSAVRLAWADRLKSQNRYAEVIEVLQAGEFDAKTRPQAMLTLSDALFAEHRFQEALDALNAIPADAEAHFQAQANMMRPIREDYLKQWEREQELRRAEESAGDLPRVLLATSRGTIILELFENEAPNTVANFISLIDSGFYNGTKFHRADPNQAVTGGDPNTRESAIGTPGQGNAGYLIADEHTREGARSHFSGSLAMFATTPNTASSQFYLTVAPTPWLNERRTVFGRVIEGLDVARQLQRDDAVEAMTVIRRRSHPYVPETLPLSTPATPAAPATTAPQLPPPTDSAATAPATAPQGDVSRNDEPSEPESE